MASRCAWGGGGWGGGGQSCVETLSYSASHVSSSRPAVAQFPHSVNNQRNLFNWRNRQDKRMQKAWKKKKSVLTHARLSGTTEMLLPLAPTALCCRSTWMEEANKTQSPHTPCPALPSPRLAAPPATAPAPAVRSRERKKNMPGMRHFHWVTACLPSPLVRRSQLSTPTPLLWG